MVIITRHFCVRSVAERIPLNAAVVALDVASTAGCERGFSIEGS